MKAADASNCLHPHRSERRRQVTRGALRVSPQRFASFTLPVCTSASALEYCSVDALRERVKAAAPRCADWSPAAACDGSAADWRSRPLLGLPLPPRCPRRFFYLLACYRARSRRAGGGGGARAQVSGRKVAAARAFVRRPAAAGACAQRLPRAQTVTGLFVLGTAPATRCTAAGAAAMTTARRSCAPARSLLYASCDCALPLSVCAAGNLCGFAGTVLWSVRGGGACTAKCRVGEGAAPPCFPPEERWRLEVRPKKASRSFDSHRPQTSHFKRQRSRRAFASLNR